MSEGNWLIQESAHRVVIWGLSQTGELQFKDITMTTINHLRSDGCVNDVTMNGTNITRQFQPNRKEVPKNPKSTLLSAGFRNHAKISVSQEMARAWKESEAVFFTRLLALPKKYSPVLFFSKMCQQYALEDYIMSPKNFPQWGMIVDGQLFLPAMLEPLIKGSGGLCLPTPVARDWKDNGKSPAELARNSTTLATTVGGQLNPTWIEWLMGLPLGWTELKPLATESCQSKPEELLDI